MYKSINPFNDQLLAEFEIHNEDDVHDILKSLSKSYENLRVTSFIERLDIVKQIADKLENVKQECAELISTEMGKPITQSLGEIDKSIG